MHTTRFPPEPKGHAKSICLDFGTAAKYGGKCNLRFDDTKPCLRASVSPRWRRRTVGLTNLICSGKLPDEAATNVLVRIPGCDDPRVVDGMYVLSGTYFH